MHSNPLKKLETLGQSIWLDYIRRDLITGGKLKKLIDDDSLRGITSNPSIFEKAIAESKDYDQQIQAIINQNKNKNSDISTLYEAITQKDVGDAADIFRPLYDKLKGKDGYVSLEVNPHLAHDTQGTITEARRLWAALNRPNVFIKVPATLEGLPAIKQLISEGININVTLLFGLPRYQAVVEAYLSGLEARIAAGASISSIASVASFFLSRIDSLIDPILEKNPEKTAKSLQGQVAVSSAKTAYQIYLEIFNSPRFKKLIEKGANVQRLLWASTSTKNPAYSDIKYIEELIGPHTVNTVPMETIDAYRDHGDPKLTLEKDMDHARLVLQQLPQFDIDIDKITQQLEDDGVDKFNKSYDQLIYALKQKTSAIQS